MCVCKYLVGRNENGGIFSGVHNDRKRGIEHKLKYSKSCLNMRKHFFTVKVIKHLHRLPREVMEHPSVEIFKT